MKKILVDNQKYKTLELADYFLEYFTQDINEAGHIETIRRHQVREKLEEGSIVFILTGLTNATSIEIEPNYHVTFHIESNLNNF